MKKVLLLAMLVLCALGASAADWLTYSTTSTTKKAIRLDSYTKTEFYFRLSIEKASQRAETKKELNLEALPYYFVEKVKFNATYTRVATAWIGIYDRQGNLLDSVDYDNLEWETIEEDSSDELRALLAKTLYENGADMLRQIVEEALSDD